MKKISVCKCALNPNLRDPEDFFQRKSLRFTDVTRYHRYCQMLTFWKGFMMSLTIRKIIVLGLIGIIFLLANILVVANWIADSGIAEKAGWVRREFLTGTAVAVICVLLILLVSPRRSGRAVTFARRCPVCDQRLRGNPNYCPDCGSKI